MAAEVGDQIKELSKLSRMQLLEKWQALCDRAAPEGIRRELLIPLLTYRIQEIAYGGLKSSTLSELRRIAREIEHAPRGSEISIRRKIKPGSRLIRHWNGRAHEVLVTGSGFEYGGTSYRSLSQIARNITGTRWSGPLFFGLKAGQKASNE
jgi:hypothetical protein